MGRPDRQSGGLWNRMRHRDEFAIERADFETAAHWDFGNRDFQPSAVVGKLGSEECGSERRRVNGHVPQARPQFDDCADMVLVAMRQYQPRKLAQIGLDELEIGQDDIHTRIVLALRKGNAEVDHHPATITTPPQAVEVAIHADLTKASQCEKYEFVFPAFSLRVACGHRSSDFRGRIQGHVAERETQLTHICVTKQQCTIRVQSSERAGDPTYAGVDRHRLADRTRTTQPFCSQSPEPDAKLPCVEAVPQSSGECGSKVLDTGQLRRVFGQTRDGALRTVWAYGNVDADPNDGDEPGAEVRRLHEDPAHFGAGHHDVVGPFQT